MYCILRGRCLRQQGWSLYICVPCLQRPCDRLVGTLVTAWISTMTTVLMAQERALRRHPSIHRALAFLSHKSSST